MKYCVSLNRGFWLSVASVSLMSLLFLPYFYFYFGNVLASDKLDFLLAVSEVQIMDLSELVPLWVEVL